MVFYLFFFFLNKRHLSFRERKLEYLQITLYDLLQNNLRNIVEVIWGINDSRLDRWIIVEAGEWLQGVHSTFFINFCV